MDAHKRSVEPWRWGDIVFFLFMNGCIYYLKLVLLLLLILYNSEEFEQKHNNKMIEQ